MEDGIDIASAAPTTKVQYKRKKLFDKMPGHMLYALRSGAQAQGCRIIQFIDWTAPVGLEPGDLADFTVEMDGDFKTAQEQVNTYFEGRANLIVMDASFDDDSITLVVGTVFDQDDLEELDLVQRVVDRELNKLREKKSQEKAKAELKAKEAAEQTKADAELGKKAREHNLLGKLEDLEKEVKRLRALSRSKE